MENQKPIVELELYLIRHGQSMGNAGYNGRTDLTVKEFVTYMAEIKNVNKKERKDKLTSLGYNYNEVQKLVNKMLKNS